MLMKKIHRQPGAVDERAADQPCRGGADATKCAPDPQRLVPLRALSEGRGDDRQGGWSHDRRADPLNHAGSRQCAGDQASPHSSDAAVKITTPAVSTRWRPSRSAARPRSSSRPPKLSAHALSTHCKPCSEKCRPTPIEGSATIVIVPSRSTMKNALHHSASARPRRRRSRTVEATRPADADDSMVNLPGSFPAAAARSGGRIVGAVGSAYTAAPGNWAPASRPVRAPGGVYTGRR
jgi:hypothetical protein